MWIFMSFLIVSVGISATFAASGGVSTTLTASEGVSAEPTPKF